jgi:surfeit locus 1 family protein
VYRFRPSLVPTLFVALGLLLLCSLGSWQLRRRAEAVEERDRYYTRLAEPPFDVAAAPPDADLRRATVTGTPDWDHHLLVHGKYMWMQPGYQVIVPVAFAGGAVLVDAGWVPQDEWALILERERAAGGTRSYAGLARAWVEDPQAAGTFPVVDGYQRDWRAVSPIAMGRAAGVEVPGWVLVDGEGIGPEAEIPDREPPIGGWRTEPQERPHGQYAFTWFSLAVCLLGMWGSASTRRTLAPPTPVG